MFPWYFYCDCYPIYLSQNLHSNSCCFVRQNFCVDVFGLNCLMTNANASAHVFLLLVSENLDYYGNFDVYFCSNEHLDHYYGNDVDVCVCFEKNVYHDYGNHVDDDVYLFLYYCLQMYFIYTAKSCLPVLLLLCIRMYQVAHYQSVEQQYRMNHICPK